SSDYDSFHAALGGRGGGAGAFDFSQGPQHHRFDWDYFVNRHRQKERDYDDRFCFGRGTQRWQKSSGCDFPGMHFAFPADSYDHDGGDVWRYAVGFRQRNGFRASQSAGYHYYWRTDP